MMRTTRRLTSTTTTTTSSSSSSSDVAGLQTDHQAAALTQTDRQRERQRRPTHRPTDQALSQSVSQARSATATHLLLRPLSIFSHRRPDSLSVCMCVCVWDIADISLHTIHITSLALAPYMSSVRPSVCLSQARIAHHWQSTPT